MMRKKNSSISYYCINDVFYDSDFSDNCGHFTAD